MLEVGTRIRVVDYENLYSPEVGKFGTVAGSDEGYFPGEIMYAVFLDGSDVLYYLYDTELEAIDE